jgi:hypothetical protein
MRPGGIGLCCSLYNLPIRKCRNSRISCRVRPKNGDPKSRLITSNHRLSWKFQDWRLWNRIFEPNMGGFSGWTPRGILLFPNGFMKIIYLPLARVYGVGTLQICITRNCKKLQNFMNICEFLQFFVKKCL